jgi:uncharacterized protein
MKCASRGADCNADFASPVSSSAIACTSAVSAGGVRAALVRPDFYPDLAVRVEVRETHISLVFRAGDRAYKLKKPLVLPFLDYGTPRRRREMCREEVRLNRRLAPDLYLGVRAVATGAGGLELAAADDPWAVDYLVEMRRYYESRTLAARLDRGEFKRSEVVALGRMLARFHAQARWVPASDVPVLAVERRLTENFYELLAAVEQRSEVERVLALERFAHAFVVAYAQLLDVCARRGCVREVKGDLRVVRASVFPLATDRQTGRRQLKPAKPKRHSRSGVSGWMPGWRAK